MQEQISRVKQADRLKALAVVNIFETGRPFGGFAAIAVLDDGAGISYGVNQFTHRSGSLAGVVERYLELGGTTGRYILENALPNLRRKEPSVIRAYAKDERVKKALRTAAIFTREMRTAQLQIAFEKYLEPAIEECERLSFATPLSLAVIYDSITHGSYEKMRERVRVTPLDVQNRTAEAVTLTEKARITEYVRHRDRWLASIPRLNATRYRTRFFLNQIMLGGWELKLPQNVNGFWLRDGHIEDLLKFADVMIGTEPAAGPILEPHKQSDNPPTPSPSSSQVLTAIPQAQPPDSGRNSTVVERASETLKTVADGFDRADAIITGIAYRSDRVKSFWTTVLGTAWQAAWAVFGFIVGLPRVVWLVVAVIAAALMLVYLYRQIALGKLREPGPRAAAGPHRRISEWGAIACNEYKLRIDLQPPVSGECSRAGCAPTNMNIHIEEALYKFRTNGGRYDRFRRYYEGQHDLAFATEKFENTFGSLFREFALNLCPAVCDAVRDRLKIEGFSVSGKRDAFTRSAEGTAEAVTLTEAISLRNRMDARSGEVHKEALKNGDAYAIVWPDADGNAAIFPNAASSCTAEYDEEDPGRIVRAAKFWRTGDKHTRVNLFYPDRIERYITGKPHESFLPESKEFVPFTGPHAARFESPDGEARGPRAVRHVILNPYGIVPVFHFANNGSIGEFGRSELEDAIPVQDGMNKSVLDMLVAMEFSAYRQRWAAGIEIEYDTEGNVVAPFKAGIDHLWIAGNEGARFGDFQTADLEQFLKVKDGFRLDIASVTGTPLYYLLPHGRGFASGEAMRKAESRFIAKVRDRQTNFGQVWADVMQFALRIEGKSNVLLQTRWEDAARMSEKETLENLLIKVQLGLPPADALREAGYGDGSMAKQNNV